jgi:hypothetical protein
MLNRKILVLIKSKYLMAILVISVFLDSIMWLQVHGKQLNLLCHLSQISMHPVLILLRLSRRACKVVASYST